MRDALNQNYDTEQEHFKDKEVDDGLNLEDHRLSQDFENLIEVKKIITTIPVRKPWKQEFIRVHPDKNMSFETHVLKVDEDNQLYAIKSELRIEAAEHIVPIALFTTINFSSDIFLWPIRLPGPDGKLNSWPQSALEAIEIAKEKWIRLTSKQSLGAYEPNYANDNLPDPKWPEMTFQQIFRIAFKNQYIDDRNHLVLKRLRGEL